MKHNIKIRVQNTELTPDNISRNILKINRLLKKCLVIMYVYNLFNSLNLINIKEELKLNEFKLNP